MSFTVFVYANSKSTHQENNTDFDTYKSLADAMKNGQLRLKNAHDSSGWVRVVDNSLTTKMSDSGMIVDIRKDIKGKIYMADIRKGYEIKIRENK